MSGTQTQGMLADGIKVGQIGQIPRPTVSRLAQVQQSRDDDRKVKDRYQAKKPAEIKSPHAAPQRLAADFDFSPGIEEDSGYQESAQNKENPHGHGADFKSVAESNGQMLQQHHHCRHA